MKIKFKSASLDQFIERYAVDVSRGGIFIRTREPLGVGTPIRFEFQLQDARPLISGEGTVVWVRDADPTRASLAPGMGVRFDKLPPDSQVVLEKILVEKGRLEGHAPEAFSAEGENATRVGDAVDLGALGGAGASVGIRSGSGGPTGPGIDYGDHASRPGSHDEDRATGFETSESTRVMSSEQMETLAEKLRGSAESVVKSIPIPRPVAPPVRRTEVGLAPTPVPSTASYGLRSDPPRAQTLTFGSKPPVPSGSFGDEVSRLPPPPVPSVPPTSSMTDTRASGQPSTRVATIPPPTPLAAKIPTPVPTAAEAYTNGEAPSQPAAMVFEPSKLEPQSNGLSNGMHGGVPALEDHWNQSSPPATTTSPGPVGGSGPSDLPTGSVSGVSSAWFDQAASDPVAPVIRTNGSMSGSGLLPPPVPTPGGVKRRRPALLIGGVSLLILATVGVVWWTQQNEGATQTTENQAPMELGSGEATPTPTPPAETAPTPPPTAEPQPAPTGTGAPMPPSAAPTQVGAPTAVAPIGGMNAPAPAMVEPKPLGSSVDVTSTPEGAKIILDGQEQTSVTPTTVEGVDSNKMHTLKLMLPGHRPFETKLGPATLRRADAKVTATLRILPGQVEVTSNPSGAQVLLDGRSVGRTPCTVRNITLDRTRRLEVKKDGYEPARRELSSTEAWQDQQDFRQLAIAVELLKVGSPGGAAGAGAAAVPTPSASPVEKEPEAPAPKPARKPTAKRVEPTPATAAPSPASAAGAPSAVPAERAPEAAPGEVAKPTPSEAPKEKVDDIKVPDWATK